MRAYARTLLEFSNFTYLSVGSGVLQQVLDELDGLSWPSGLGHAELLTLTGSTDGRVESSEWNGSLVVQDLVQVLLGSFQTPAVNGLGGLPGVLERNTQVGTTSRSGFSRVSGSSTVSSHFNLLVVLEDSLFALSNIALKTLVVVLC